MRISIFNRATRIWLPAQTFYLCRFNYFNSNHLHCSSIAMKFKFLNLKREEKTSTPHKDFDSI